MEILEYIENLNSAPELFPDMLSYAAEHKVPIMDSDALQVMKHYMHLTDARNILEIGTAIGYSAMHMLSVRDDVSVVTIEKDESSHETAQRFFEEYAMASRVKSILGDAKEVRPESLSEEPFDMLFIDASKGNNEYFFETYSPLVKNNGLIVVDNILLRGLVAEEDIQSRNRRRMKEKVDAFNKRIASSGMLSSFLPVGDGLLIISKKEEGTNA